MSKVLCRCLHKWQIDVTAYPRVRNCPLAGFGFRLMSAQCFERFVDRPVSGESANCFVRHFFLARGLDRQVQPGLTPPAHLSPCVRNPPVSLSVCVCVCERVSVWGYIGAFAVVQQFQSTRHTGMHTCVDGHTHKHTYARACARAVACAHTCSHREHKATTRRMCMRVK